MKLYLFFLLYFFNFIRNIICKTEGVYFPKKEDVIILTDYTFEEAILEYKFLLISVYSDYCITCIKQINPTFSNVSKEIENNEPELKDIVGIAKIDGSYNRYFMNKYNILGYPSILLLKNGVIESEIIHRNNVQDIIIFLRKHILKPIQYIKNKEQFNRLVKNSARESFITYFGTNNEEINSLIENSYFYNHLTFVNIQGKKLIKELNATEGQISINKFFDEPRIIENAKNNELWTSDNINKFIKKYNHRILIDFLTLEGENLLNQKKNILLLINKIELTKEQIKRVIMDKYDMKDAFLKEENKINNKNFFIISKNVRDIIQSSFIIYRKNLNEDYYINKNKKKRKSLLDAEDPFGFEIIKQEKLDCERRQIQYIQKFNLDNDSNCEIRLIDFENDKNPIFYKLFCGKEFIEENINFIKRWYNKNLTENDIGIYLN